MLDKVGPVAGHISVGHTLASGLHKGVLSATAIRYVLLATSGPCPVLSSFAVLPF